MSILFEAWRRARGKESRLAETLGAPPVVSAPRRPLVPWLLCILLAAIAVGLAVYLWRTHGPRPAPAVAAAAVGSAAPANRVARPAAPIASAPKTTVVATPQPLPPQASAPAARAAVAANGQPDVGTPMRAPANASSAALEPQQTETAPYTAPIGGIAPDNVREALPPLAVTVHVWNEDPAKRFIMIAGRVYRPGDEITSGVQLLDITRSGETVGFRGYRVELPGG